MTISSSEINLQSKHDLICQAAKVKAITMTVMVLVWSFTGMKDLKRLK